MGDAGTAVFRADAAPDIGGGHVVRCLTLADALARAGWRCGFAVKDGTLETVPALARSGHDVHVLGQDPGAEPSEMAGHWSGDADWLVVDHYERDAAFETACRPWARRIMAIDDLADRAHDCDLLLDQTLGREAADYAAHIPETCRLLLGPAYALVRPSFGALREATLARRAASGRIERILVSLGASDPHDVTAVVLDGIAQAAGEARVDVVLGAAAPHLEAIRHAVDRLPPAVHLHVDPPDMAGLMAEADLAVGAAGTSSWERCCLGLPCLVVITGRDQYRVAEALERSGCVAVLGDAAGVSGGIVADALEKALSAGEPGAEAWRRAALVCDGLGCARLGMVLDGAQARDGGRVRLRPAAMADAEALLAWQNEAGARRHFREPRVPDPDEHRLWLERRLADPHGALNIVLHEEEPSGYLRLDLAATPSERRVVYEVSILVAAAKQRLGLGRAALALSRAMLPWAEFHAEVAEANEASFALFAGAGYRQDGDRFVSPAMAGR